MCSHFSEETPTQALRKDYFVVICSIPRAGLCNLRYGVALSLPSVVGHGGVSEVLWPAMCDVETRGLERSAETLRNAVAHYVAPH